MSYLGISQAAANPHLRSRITGCIAQEDSSDEHPQVVMERIIWKCCGEPGWGEAWESALAAERPLPYDPGLDPAVIPDAWILTAVQKHIADT